MRTSHDIDQFNAVAHARHRRLSAGNVLIAALAATAIFAGAAGATIPEGSAQQGATEHVAPPPTNPLVPPQGDVIVDQTGDRLVYRDPSTGQTTARTFGTQVAYLDPTGAWKPLNNALQPALAGGYTNAAGPVHLNFATSSDAQHLVSLTNGDNSVSFGLAGAQAAAPTVVGDSVTYPRAVGGADLRYQVLAGELKETLILSQAPTGDGPVTYDFPIDLHGLTPQIAKDGTIQLVDALGSVAFAIPTGVAVDSAPSDGDTGGARTVVPISLVGDPQTGWSIELQLDAAWLRSSDRVYPVYVDPSYTWTAGSGVAGSGGYDAYVSSSAPNTNFDGSGQLSGSNYIDPASATTSVRSTDAFYDLSWLSGRSVSAAAWYGDAINATTYPAGYQIQPLSGSWTETGVTWNTQPGTISGASVSGSVAAGNSWQSNDITTWAQNWAGGTWTNNGVVISHSGSGTNLNFAADESSQSLRSYIQVTYDSYPKTPNMRQPAPSVATSQLTPQLSARVTDPDGGNVYGDFEIWNASTGGTLLYAGTGSTATSGDRSSWTTPTLTDGTTYWWDVRGDDGSIQSTYTTRRSFKIDTTPPATPGISSTTYTSGTWSSSTSGPFTFSNAGSGDVVGYYYDFDNQNPTANNTTSGTPTLTAPSTGWHELDVRSYDAAGNLSPLATFTYGVTPGGVFGISAGARTQGPVTFSADASTTYDGFALQYRRADDQSWTTVPAGNVTYQSSGLGISSWPVTLSGSPRRTSVNLVWDASTALSSVNGPVQERAVYYISGTPQGVYSGAQTFTLDSAGFGSRYASVPIGPGSVNPVTGNFALSMSDATTGTIGFQRIFNSRTPSTAGLYGPGWTTALSTAYASLADNGDTVTITGGDGSTMSFYLNSSATAYLPSTDAAGSTLTKPSSGRFELVDPGGNTTGFQIPSGGSVYVPFDMKTPATGLSATTISWQTSSGVEQPTKILAAAAPGVTCGALSAGCRELLFNYAASTTATGTGSSQWGDYINQLKTVKYKAWDTELGTPGFTIDTVATYRYDSNGLLRSEWDPRISPSLKTTYSYDANGEISTLTPPGMNAWTFTYATISGDSNTGRLSTVQRNTATAGTGTTTVIYKVPLSGTGAPFNLSGSEIARWGQRDTPTDATAIFPADEVPSSNPPTDYNRATVYYGDASGRLVDLAQPSPSSCATTSGFCNVTTTEYNAFGEAIRTLSADNRQAALNASSTDSAYNEALLASQLDTQTVYSSDGTELQDQYGPAHNVTQPPPNDDQIITVREHAHYDYDQGAPTGANCPCRLVTTTTEAATPLDGSADFDVRTTTYAYNIATDLTGWTLRQPVLTTLDPSGQDLVTTTLYDVTTGLPTERRLPAGPSGGDAHATLFISYTAGTNSRDASCGNRPEYALLLCKQEPAAQPGTSGMPNIPVTTHSAYNRYDLPLTITDVMGSDSRSTTFTYDSGFRQHTESISSTVGASVPTTTWGYDSSTGKQTTTSDGTSTITRVYAGDGTMTSYTDSGGNTSSYTYNVNGYPASVNNGKVTDTITYDASVDSRGIPTSITDPSAGTLSATRDADGNLLTETYPGGVIATREYDSVGFATHLDYSKSGSTWLTFDDLDSIHGEVSASSSTLSATTYTYDGAGRLASAQQVIGAAGCVTRQYGFDSDSNRTSTGTYTPAADGSCSTSSGTTQTRTFDSADRATLSGYAYDGLGDTTTVPSVDAPTGLSVSASYYANSMVNALTVSGDTRSFQIDPTTRIGSWTDSVDGITRTNHYITDDDNPAWTTTNTAGTSWTRNIVGFGGLSAILTHPASGSETVKLDLTDLQGNVVATADPTGSTYDTPTLVTDEYGDTEPLSGTAQYSYQGGALRSQDALSGFTLMGRRLYDPVQGRFEQTDPVLGGSANSYDYTGGDPVNRSDLSGQLTMSWPLFRVQYEPSGMQFWLSYDMTIIVAVLLKYFEPWKDQIMKYTNDKICEGMPDLCDKIVTHSEDFLANWIIGAYDHYGCAYMHLWYWVDPVWGYSVFPNSNCQAWFKTGAS